MREEHSRQREQHCGGPEAGGAWLLAGNERSTRSGCSILGRKVGVRRGGAESRLPQGLVITAEQLRLSVAPSGLASCPYLAGDSLFRTCCRQGA